MQNQLPKLQQPNKYGLTPFLVLVKTHHSLQALVEIPKERRFGVEMRLYNDRSQVTIICSSQHPDLYHYNEVNISASEWKNYTIAAFKKTLQSKGWPATKPGG